MEQTMQTHLPFKVGQSIHNDGKKHCSDWFDFKIPQGEEFFHKGCGFAFACAASPSLKAKENNQTVVRSFLLDYYSTPNTWDTDESIQKVVRSINGWLNAQNQYSRQEEDNKQCKFVAVVLLENQAFVINVGGVPMYLFRNNSIDSDCFKTKLERPLGSSFICISQLTVQEISSGDVLILANSLLNEHICQSDLLAMIQKRDEDLNHTAFAIVKNIKHANLGALNSCALIEVL